MKYSINKFEVNDEILDFVGVDINKEPSTNSPVSASSVNNKFIQTNELFGLYDYPLFDISTNYEINDVVVYNNKLYKFINQHIASKWSEYDVKSVSIKSIDETGTIVSRYLFAMVDSKNKFICGIDENINYIGDIDWYSQQTKRTIDEIQNKLTTHDVSINIIEENDNDEKYISEMPSVYTFSIIDSSNKVVFGIKPSGEFIDALGVSDSISKIPNIENDIENINNRIEGIEDAIGDVIDIKTKQIVCWGDSLTAVGHYETKLKELLGSNYNVINLGVGGESDLAICARAGAVFVGLNEDVVLPSDGTPVQIGTLYNSGFYMLSTNGEKKNAPFLLQGERGSVNNVYINDIECKFTWTGNKYNDTNGIYILQRVNPIDTPDITLKADSPVLTNGVRSFRNPHAAVLWIGTNKSWDNTSEETIQKTLIQEYRKLIDIVGTTNYIIVGLHHYSGDYELLEKVMTNEFGTHYLNWRKYLVDRALDDAGLTPTENDLNAINQGKCPPQLLTDGVHHTTTAYHLLGKQIYQRMMQTNML